MSVGQSVIGSRSPVFTPARAEGVTLVTPGGRVLISTSDGSHSGPLPDAVEEAATADVFHRSHKLLALRVLAHLGLESEDLLQHLGRPAGLLPAIAEHLAEVLGPGQRIGARPGPS